MYLVEQGKRIKTESITYQFDAKYFYLLLSQRLKGYGFPNFHAFALSSRAIVVAKKPKISGIKPIKA
jgi:hypothetical protein